jgi:hypothetical protein
MNLATWLERLTASAKVATVLGSILASSDTVESAGQHMKEAALNKEQKKSLCLYVIKRRPARHKKEILSYRRKSSRLLLLL